ncbi:MAG: manganese efflux pump MntP family protein [Synergistaceae bacterium]|jgi:putative Mn2+ efflux pump MntP|nr:manganese efflux pump MntP family protein [Synergistaceae bacterium]
MLESVLSAVSLSVDAFAVALCIGACVIGATVGTAFRMGLACGVFQFFMPIAGWIPGAYCAASIASVDHWIAFGLLAFVGGNMIRSSFSAPGKCDSTDPTRSMKLLYLALATSIDALAVGASFALVQKPVLLLSGCAGFVTALLCFGGVQVGRLAGQLLGRRVELAGGLLLCLIGLNILRVHLRA